MSFDDLPIQAFVSIFSHLEGHDKLNLFVLNKVSFFTLKTFVYRKLSIDYYFKKINWRRYSNLIKEYFKQHMDKERPVLWVRKLCVEKVYYQRDHIESFYT